MQVLMARPFVSAAGDAGFIKRNRRSCVTSHVDFMMNVAAKLVRPRQLRLLFDLFLNALGF
jgi:hypothetical protein